MDDFGKACTEVCQVLKFLDNTYINSIPKKLIEFLKENKDDNYQKEINPEEPLENQNLLQETIDLIALIKLSYWCREDEEKTDFQELLYENEKKSQQAMRERYNPDDIFKEKVSDSLDSEKENVQLIEYNKENFWKKVLKKIKDFLRV